MIDPRKEIDKLLHDFMVKELRQKSEPPENPLFETIEQYKKTTGKKFRMTKEQKARKISREEAFKEYVNKVSK